MVRIRLRRVGGKKQPSYRIVASDKESPRDGRFLEILGYYNPRTEPPTIDVHEERLYEWMIKGAQPSDSVKRILQTVGTWERFERFKKGESSATLQAEAAAAAGQRLGSPKTSQISAPRKKKSKAE